MQRECETNESNFEEGMWMARFGIGDIVHLTSKIFINFFIEREVEHVFLFDCPELSIPTWRI